MPVQIVGLQIDETTWEYREKGREEKVYLVYSSVYPIKAGADSIVRWTWWYDHGEHGYADHMTQSAAVTALVKHLEKRGQQL